MLKMEIFSRIKFDGLRSRDWLIYKYPSDKIVMGSQLIVNEGQAVIFVKGGQVCDRFTAGTYTLSTSNIPILQSIVNLPFGGNTPFTAEIYYINMVTKLDIKWGTIDPIQIIDPKYFVKLRVRAFGQFGLKIVNEILFFKELIGAMGPSEIIQYDVVKEYYKGILITKIKSIIADIIINNKISALEINAKLDEISECTKSKIIEEFEQYGLTVANFYIQSINFPEEDFNQINKILEDKAAFEIMGDARYSTKRTFDVYEGAANNESGLAGAFAAGGIGLSAGATLAQNASKAIEPSFSESKSAMRTCPNCEHTVSATAKFCDNCGTLLEEKKIFCYKCNAENSSNAKFCCECGTSLTAVKCECGQILAPGTKFCNECGKKVE